MRLILLSLIVGLGVAITQGVGATETKVATKTTTVNKASKTKKAKAVKGQKSKKTAVKGPKSNKPELSTDVRFDDSTVHGQYQTPDEALAKVEDEKGLSDLIGVRKHFKDRLSTASEQE